jgi:hypothetical protein
MANTQEYGLFQLLDLGLLNPNATAQTQDSGLLVSAIQMDAAQHNADIDSVLRFFAVDTTDYQQEVQQSGSSRNQPLDENGRAIPIKPVAPYTVAFPIQSSGTAWGANYVTRIQMSVRDLARTFANMYRGDFIWVQDHVMGALFANTSYTFRDPTGKGNLTIRGPANGDATTYYYSTTNALATETHFLAQAAAIADATNPYPTIKTELLEHPSNTGDVIAFIASDLVATTKALAEFRSSSLDPDIRLPSTATVLTRDLGITLPPGTTVHGKTDSGVWIVEWTALPSTYIVAVTTGGPRPLARRMFPEAQLQGFKSAGERNDFPFFENQWQRWEGYGAFNRLGTVIVRIGSGSYAVPTNMAMPMP